jgi:3'(2'), 5'-bisphosphate nucleotidase
MHTEAQKSRIGLATQAKYGALARGDAEVYLRLPQPGKRYEEKIWDHAAGKLRLNARGSTLPCGCRSQKIHPFISFPHSPFSGVVVVEEAGGAVTDINGKPLDFSVGRTLKENTGTERFSSPFAK